MDEQIYYGFIQLNHGADHVFIYTKEQILEEFERHKINPDVLNRSRSYLLIPELDGFPIGGSNSSASRIWYLEGDEAAKAFICQKAEGPDYEDPPLVGLAEYYFALDAGEGCMKELLEKFGIDKEKQENIAMREVKADTDLVCETLGIEHKDFYEDEYRSVRVSEVYFLAEVRELVNNVEDLIWSDKASEPEIRIKLPEKMAKKILRFNDFDVYWENSKDRNMIDETYLVIEKEPDGEVGYDFIEYAGGNSLKIPHDESEDLMKEVIQKIVSDAVSGIEEEKDL